MHIKIREGLDIAMKGGLDENALLSKIETLIPRCVALNLEGLSGKKGFHLLVKEGDLVLQGAPVGEDKEFPESKLVSPITARVKAILRGPKRSLESIVLEREAGEVHAFPLLTPDSLSRETLLIELQRRGLFNHLRQRPFNIVANPTKTPKSIFVKALESAPFVPRPDLEIQTHAEAFQAGLDFLSLLTEGPIHLIHRKDACDAVVQAHGVQHTTIEGPHPSSNLSLHIHYLDPIENLQDCVWTLSAWDVLAIGKTLTTGRYFSERLVALAGEGILESKRSLIRTVVGASIGELVQGRIEDPDARIIAGDPLMGRAQGTGEESEGYMNRSDNCISAISTTRKRPFLHFFRLGLHQYTASGAYASNYLTRKYSLNTSLHGEERAFIDSEPYQRVMPMQVPVMHLVKAVLAENFGQAQVLGILEVDAEDFALPCFVCPSKIEMVTIIKQALHRWAHEML